MKRQNNRASVEKFTDQSKKRLAAQVKIHPCLWRKSDSNYSKRDAKQAAWNQIAEDLNLEDSNVTIKSCRDCWKSLTDALRYQKKKIPGKSGDSLEATIDSENEMDSSQQLVNNENNESFWTFSDDLKFLEEDVPTRKTISTINELNEETTKGANDTAVLEVLDTPVQNVDINFGSDNTENMKQTPKVIFNKRSFGQSYVYDQEKTKLPKKLKTEPSPDDRIADSLQSLVELRKATISADTPQSSLKYYSMFLNLDRMLQKLPEEEVEDLNFEFISLIREKLKSNKLQV